MPPSTYTRLDGSVTTLLPDGSAADGLPVGVVPPSMLENIDEPKRARKRDSSAQTQPALPGFDQETT